MNTDLPSARKGLLKLLAWQIGLILLVAICVSFS